MGSILIAILADIYGRRPAMLLVIHFLFLLLKYNSLIQSMVTMALGAFLETLVHDFYLLCACTFLNSFGKWALFQVTLVTSKVLAKKTIGLHLSLQVYLSESIGFERRLERFPWISYNSLVTITFFIPYCLGKMVATKVVEHLKLWREFEKWIAVASCIQIVVVFLIPESPRWLLFQCK